LRCVFVEAHDEVRNKNGEGGRECYHTTGSGWKKEVVVVVIWGMMRKMIIDRIATPD